MQPSNSRIPETRTQNKHSIFSTVPLKHLIRVMKVWLTCWVWFIIIHCVIFGQGCLSFCRRALPLSSLTELYILKSLKKVVVILVMTSGLAAVGGISKEDAGILWYCTRKNMNATSVDVLIATRNMNTSHELVDMRLTQAVCNIGLGKAIVLVLLLTLS